MSTEAFTVPEATLPVDPTDGDPQDVADTLAVMAACCAPFDVVVAGQRIRYQPEANLRTEALAAAAAREAYPDNPSVPRLSRQAAIAYHLWMQSDLADRCHPGIVAAETLRERQFEAVLFEAVMLDIVALQSGTDIHSPTECAQLANRLRELRGLDALHHQEARVWLRSAYADWLRNGPHSVECPGGCQGSGEVRVALAGREENGAQLNLEPLGCRRGELLPGHPADCLCHGTGFVRERGERQLCLGLIGELPLGPVGTGR
ncbi:hypothetical protein [Streptomyces sp. NRRL S-350]|uniref:hypothetical protein n=1 Tax=Streptomyces sp. NRRL S-350 TaxID=1463902 RepID=UPI0004C0E8EE|nr:hypothetical protein [Streptomyces sp. NRRL S-350]